MKLEPITITMIQREHVKDFTFLDGVSLIQKIRIDGDFNYQDDAFLLFANMETTQTVEPVFKCFDKNVCEDTCEYLVLCFSEIKQLVGEYAAKLIMMESINEYLECGQREINVSKIRDDLSYRFNKLLGMASLFTGQLTRNEHSEDYLSKSLCSPIFEQEMKPYIDDTGGLSPYTVLAILLENTWLPCDGIAYRAIPGYKGGKAFFFRCIYNKKCVRSLIFRTGANIKRRQDFKTLPQLRKILFSRRSF